MEQLNLGIIGAGWIADKMAETVSGLPQVRKYAIAARDEARAKDFANHWHFDKAYGSYEALVADPSVDLVYIATPHSHHFRHASLALNAGKAVLCEKAFTANAREAEALIALAHEKHLLLTEAIWTRYMPLSKQIKEVMDSGVIGEPLQLSATLSYSMGWKDRIMKAELCGGALLDLGVYCINFARMYFGTDIVNVTSSCVKGGADGMDMHDSITLAYRNGRVANLQSSALCLDSRNGMICGDKGFLLVDNINCPTSFKVFNKDYQVTAEYRCPSTQITGYEYQVLACREALLNGQIECADMPHAETIAIMRMMDGIRKSWGVVYPYDDEK
ncbi:MAG: Gfo/Idh/MocA family oxidoreductase [Prevotella sp.]|nr:Gfo/Idh/MocA family oxidoreductase [Candidatus Equicola faecalis]